MGLIEQPVKMHMSAPVHQCTDLQGSLSMKITLLSHTLRTNSLLDSSAGTRHTDTETDVLPPNNSPTNSSSQESSQNSDIQFNPADHVSTVYNRSAPQPAADPCTTNTNQSNSQVQSPLSMHIPYMPYY